jgi:hypothetical protein
MTSSFFLSLYLINFLSIRTMAYSIRKTLATRHCLRTETNEGRWVTHCCFHL